MRMHQYEKKHLQQLRDGLAECTVLLKANGDFPLKKPEKLALYGSGARHTIKGGTGSGEVNSRFFVTVEQGLKDAGFVLTTDKWLDGYDQIYADAQKAFVKRVRAEAKAAHRNVVVYGMGAVMPEPEYQLPLDGEGSTAVYVLSRISGEGNDRRAEGGDILLSETEKKDILQLSQSYERFMLVLNVGGPVDLSPVASVQNILVLSQLGVETGAVLADILLGKSYPSGKLATTWAKWNDYPDIGEFGQENNTRYREGIYVGYRYFDSVGKRALYPFGYGLGFTVFSLTESSISVKGERIRAEVTVSNTGSHPGKEVVQLYVSVPSGRLDQPYQMLAGWAKTRELAPGESQRVSVGFSLTDIASYDEGKESYLLEQGDYRLRIGNSSADTVLCGILRLGREVITLAAKNVCGKPDFTDWKPQKHEKTQTQNNVGQNLRASAFYAENSGVPIFEINAADITSGKAEYDRPQEVDPLIEKLSDEQLSYLNIGAFDPRGGIGSIIGNAGISVAGAAGETTGMAKDAGIPALVMADGPAGLRLATAYTKDERGVHSLGNPMLESLSLFLNPPARFALKLMSPRPKKGVKVYRQFATAIPIGTAVAQSWNLDFAQSCGDIVGDEMQRFGVQLWLAPALNIHRSIRCGRNFEYYSEDPLISGRFAAAVTRGVQKHPGCGTTIKHYAANNQETNRYNNNSMVSERAMREIYLKGFGICIRESSPHALMTSYNLLNGVHTSECRGLIEDVLRSEYGYEGIVMTDWVTAGSIMSKNAVYPPPEAYKVALAGNDLFMPGSKKEFHNLMDALKHKRIDRRQLAVNATRVYRMAKRLTKKEG